MAIQTKYKLTQTPMQREVQDGRYRNLSKSLEKIGVGAINACYLRCRYCGNSSGPDKRDYMPLSMYEFILSHFRINERVFFGLGEPTKHPQIAQFIGLTLENEVNVDVATNGFNLKKLTKLFQEFEGKKNINWALSVSSMHNEQYELKGKNLIERAKELTELAREYNVLLEFRPLSDRSDEGDNFLFRMGEEVTGNKLEYFYSSVIKDVGRGKYCPRAFPGEEEDDYNPRVIFIGPTGRMFATTKAWYEDLDDLVIAQIQEMREEK